MESELADTTINSWTERTENENGFKIMITVK